ncbi:YjcZ family sporulation protein [Radiobacillus deserti]|uniref:YjcZ family sporulation protein n=1 Tax=Radiobacillus deserti TaxID=2594883 RepID=A0A516KHT3_9BACI|nr:YjcZ family sporulation protein [Radiobacillus deserti]QDP40942.1 YjcZ family sporulation protein [Radiobacillus deserti]
MSFFQGNQNSFILLVVLFVLLVIVGNNYPTGQGYGYGGGY